MSPAEAFNTTPGKSKKVILVVDDESGIREFLATYLTSKNFLVLTADGPDEAVRIWKRDRDQIDLLLTDVLMPGINGTVLSQQFRAEKPGLKVIFMSGYLPQEIAEETMDHVFFKKPFHPSELLEAIREVLH